MCLTLDSESATMTMNMVRSVPTTVVVEGRLTLEFAFDEFMRIRSWIFLIRSHREMIMRSMLGIQDPAFLEQLSKNITRYGVPSNTLNFFRLCVILEPMQELMSRQKAYSLTPRDCLKTTLFQKWQRMMPQEATRQPSKRRKRKGSAAASDSSNNSGTGGRASKRKQSPLPIPPHQMAQPGDVMIVGEPTLMGGDFGDEDERLITRLENTQYDAAAAAAAAGGGVSTIPSSSHIHPNFPCPNESPAGLISSSSLGNMPMNSVSHSGVSFRGPLSSGGGSSTNPMGMNEPVFANSFSSMTPQHLSNLSGSMIPNQVGGISASMPGRLMPQNTSAAMSQQYGPMPGKISLSGSNTPSSRDLYQGPFSAGTMDVVHQPARANSASSLLDGNNGSGVGFSSCPSPSLINSRPAPARFTPPSMPNGLGNSVTSSSTPSSSSQPSFAIPADMMSCSVNSNNPQQQQSQQPQQQQQQQTPMSGPVLSSPMPSSYTPDAMDTTAGGILHSSTPVASQPVVSSVSKSSNSPLMFACMGNNAGGNQLLPEGPLPSMMTSSSAGDPTSGMSMNENEDLKPPPPCLAHQSRSASESGEA
ncbi:unnamed protein product [Calicophoron daubneyi]|uniref:LIM interaction domain-containing protein n=1 Tax=Calicophoron daubneyi TaxID=300641 RepID=A0AAV2T0G9_CALDB